MQEHVTHLIGPALAPYVSRITGYRLSGLAPGTHIGMPSTALTLIVAIDEPILVSDTSGDPVAYGGLVSGLLDRPVRIHHDGSQHGVQIDLTPVGARALLGVPASEIVDRMLPLDDVVPGMGRLPEHAADHDRLGVSVGIVVAELRRRLGRAPSRAARPEVAHAWDVIRRAQGRVPIWSVASSVGWSTRHLGEQFRSEYGVTPKTAARLSRFETAHRMVRAGRPLAQTALLCGFANQAHLNREWRQFAGTSPTRWRADDALAFFQDVDPGKG